MQTSNAPDSGFPYLHVGHSGEAVVWWRKKESAVVSSVMMCVEDLTLCIMWDCKSPMKLEHLSPAPTQRHAGNYLNAGLPHFEAEARVQGVRVVSVLLLVCSYSQLNRGWCGFVMKKLIMVQFVKDNTWLVFGSICSTGIIEETMTMQLSEWRRKKVTHKCFYQSLCQWVLIEKKRGKNGVQEAKMES